MNKLRIYLLTLLAVIGCADNPIKITYSDWITEDFTVSYIYNNKATLVTKEQAIIVDNNNYQAGQIVKIIYRKKYTTKCENNHCELLKTEVELQ